MFVFFSQTSKNSNKRAVGNIQNSLMSYGTSNNKNSNKILLSSTLYHLLPWQLSLINRTHSQTQAHHLINHENSIHLISHIHSSSSHLMLLGSFRRWSCRFSRMPDWAIPQLLLHFEQCLHPNQLIIHFRPRILHPKPKVRFRINS